MKIGLALSGGGARGFYHSGLLQALHEYGFKPDVIAGTSAGSIAGALFAAGVDANNVMEKFPSKLSSLALNPVRIMRNRMSPGNILREYLTEYLEGKNFEDLDISLKTTAVNLVNGKLAIIEKGPLIQALIASSSIPGILSPKNDDMKNFIDGGVLLNLPASVIREECDFVIGVNLLPFLERPDAASMSRSQKIHRSIEIAHHHNNLTQEKHCDHLICNPKLGDFSTFEFSAKRAVYDLGYKDGLELVELIDKGLLFKDKNQPSPTLELGNEEER